MLNKPINASPHNISIDRKNGFNISYEIPNNAMINGRRYSINKIDTGEQVYSSGSSFANATSNVKIPIPGNIASMADDEEYSWNSFYYKIPDDERATTYIVSDANEEENKICLRPQSKVIERIDADYSDSPTNPAIEENVNKYGAGVYEEYHDKGSDTSKYCCEGQLEDYFGYPMIWVRWSSSIDEIITNEIGLGNCIIEIYDSDERLALRAKILAFEYDNPTGAYGYIVDDSRTASKMRELETYRQGADIFYRFKYINLVDKRNFNKSQSVAGLMRWDSLALPEGVSYKPYYLLSNGMMDDYSICTYSACGFPKHKNSENEIVTMRMGDEISLWDRDNADFNITPTYYFRTKTPPIVSIAGYDSGGTYNVTDLKKSFGINYESSIYPLNYFYLYLYASNGSGDWILKERSPMLHSIEDTYEFSGFVDGEQYSVSAVCYDTDGDEWLTDFVNFNVSLEIERNIVAPATFNRDTSAIDVSLSEILSLYTEANVEFYKVKIDDIEKSSNVVFSGGGFAKRDVVIFNKWSDHNIKNDTAYKYYVRIEFDSGNVNIYETNMVVTNFEGTYILGINKKEDGNLVIVNRFDILYHFDKDSRELTYNISRDYVDTFGTHPKELKGHSNHLSGSCSGLLGSGCNGEYSELRGVRDAWHKFINDDSVKLYKGIDGETLVISIETSKIRPSYFPSTGIVNEVIFTFKEILPADKLSIFTIEKIGD